MEEISTVGIDLAKSVFHIRAIDAAGNVIVRRQLRRKRMLKFFEQLAPCFIGMEACGTAHYWAPIGAVTLFEVRARKFPLWLFRQADEQRPSILPRLEAMISGLGGGPVCSGWNEEIVDCGEDRNE
ncbi:hypothetical protein C9427_33485, partial [Mesorhizobium helmanticense]